MRRVLVQAGHVTPRHPGFERGTGTAGEQELVHEVQHKLILLLANDPRLEPVHYHGDLTNAPKEKALAAALFLHADGSTNRSASGYSFGFPSHPVNRQLANRLDSEFKAIGHPGGRRKDNYTGALAGYYGYRYVNTPGPELVVEHGFLTNPAERAWLFANTGKLALAEYRALCSVLGVNPDLGAADPAPEPRDGAKPWPIPLPVWFWAWARWYRGHGEYKELGPHHPLARPCDAKYPIPKWAWARLNA